MKDYGRLWEQLLPAFLNFLLWLLGLSLSLVSIILGHVGSSISAANAIINSVSQVTTVLNAGMAGASAIVVGNTIGEGNIEKAKRESNTYVVLSVLFGIIVILPLLLLERPYVGLYNITEETRQIAHGMMLVTCGMMPIQTMAYVTSKGILRGVPIKGNYLFYPVLYWKVD